MNKTKYFESMANKNDENNLLRFVVVILTIGLLLEGLLMVYMRKNERTVIVPSYLDRKFYVEGNKASTEYIEMMAKYSVELITNFTPDTVKERVNEFMRFISPTVYKDVSTSLLVMVDEATTYKISQYFIPQRMVMQDNSIQIIGLLRKYTQDKELLVAKAEYRMKFYIEQGRFVIASYEKIETPDKNDQQIENR
ncbi:MAG: TraE/TraK family type IV conjugative transfer system protein [Thermodesulfovibrionales bacterium]